MSSLTGFRDEQLQGRQVGSLLQAADAHILEAAVLQALAGGTVVVMLLIFCVTPLLPVPPSPFPCLIFACPGEPVVALEVPIATVQYQEHPTPVNLNSMLLSISPMYNPQGTVNEVG